MLQEFPWCAFGQDRSTEGQGSGSSLPILQPQLDLGPGMVSIIPEGMDLFPTGWPAGASGACREVSLLLMLWD